MNTIHNTVVGVVDVGAVDAGAVNWALAAKELDQIGRVQETWPWD